MLFLSLCLYPSVPPSFACRSHDSTERQREASESGRKSERASRRRAAGLLKSAACSRERAEREPRSLARSLALQADAVR